MRPDYSLQASRLSPEELVWPLIRDSKERSSRCHTPHRKQMDSVLVSGSQGLRSLNLWQGLT